MSLVEPILIKETFFMQDILIIWLQQEKKKLLMFQHLDEWDC